MIGKAGRPSIDDSGFACVFVQEEKKNFFQKFLYEPFPVESTLDEQLTDHLNTEIAHGAIKSTQECVESLKWTYFYRRLAKNPSFYDLENTTDEEIELHLR